MTCGNEEHRDAVARKLVDDISKLIETVTEEHDLPFLLVVSRTENGALGSIACSSGFAVARSLVHQASTGIDAAEKIVAERAKGMPVAG